MRTLRQSLIGLFIAALITALVYMLIVNGLRNPLVGKSTDYVATFTDVSGLRQGADVRRQGVQVGKVTAIKVVREGNSNVAQVDLELLASQRITTATRLAVRYQNLAGSRYIDIRDTESPAPLPISRIPTAQTTGSLDITTIFSGLTPMLDELDPAEINDLTDKLAVFLEGDGGGATELLKSIQVVAGRTVDQQQTIDMLIQNMSVFSEKLQGNSGKIFQFLGFLNALVRQVVAAQDKLVDLADKGPGVVTSLDRLLWVAGLRPGTDLNAKFDVMRANLYRIPEFFERLPGIYGGMQPAIKNPGSDVHCSNGTMTLPPMVKMFINDEQLVLCNRLPQ
ncbi:MlaD family protein [Mycolicibacter minnesotensis]